MESESSSATGRREAPPWIADLEALRPRLHRYCSRLLASPLDAEDVVQEVLADACLEPPAVASAANLENWLFRVAYNRSIDQLRRRAVRLRPLAPVADRTEPDDPVEAIEAAEQAFGHLVRRLPPKERASLVLKDVLDHSLEETATLLGSSVGAVKAALHRARVKLRAASGEGAGESAPGEPRSADESIVPDPRQARLIAAYAERFNARDWDGLIAMLQADAELRVAEVFEGAGRSVFEQRYFRNYSRLSVDWRARAVELAGDAVVLIERRAGGELRPYSAVRVAFDGERIAGVTDYLHAPAYVLDALARRLGLPAPAGFEWAHLPGARSS